MYIGVLQFTMAIPYAASLKDKRSVVQSLKDRLRRDYNVAVAEVDDLDVWTSATFGAVMISNDVPRLNSALDRLLATLEQWRDAQLEDHQLEIIHPEDGKR